MKRLLLPIMIFFSPMSIAKVASMSKFDGFSWGASLANIEKRHGDKYKQEGTVINYMYIGSILDKKPDRETVGGLTVISRAFIFDKECGFFTSCQLVKGTFGLDIESSRNTVPAFIKKLSMKYGNFIEAKSPNYTFGPIIASNSYEAKELYWFAKDKTYIKLTYGVLIDSTHTLTNPTSKIGDIHHIKLTYSGIADVTFKKESETKKQREIGF